MLQIDFGWVGGGRHVFTEPSLLPFLVISGQKYNSPKRSIRSRARENKPLGTVLNISTLFF